MLCKHMGPNMGKCTHRGCARLQDNGRTPNSVLKAPRGKAIQAHVYGVKLDVARTRVSAGLTNASLLPITTVGLYSPAANNVA